MNKIIKLRITGYYPCPWDDIIDKNSNVYVSIYTLKNAKKDPLLKLNKEGIKFDKKDKIYDIVVDVPELTEKIVKNSLKQLSEITGIGYTLGKAKKRFVSVDI